MKKRSIVLLVLGFVLIILPFIFNIFNIFNILRLLCIIVGIFLTTLGVALNKKNHIILVIIIPLIIFAITYAFDMLLFYTFHRIPVYVYEIKSNDNVKNYNSFFYRLYSCNNNLIMDYGYQMEYACDTDLLKTLDINEILSNPQESYTKYKNKFVRVHGKIGKIVNLDRIELNMYDKDDININGYVNFNFNYSLNVPVKNDLKDLRIYEEIDVIGRINKLTNNGTTLIMVDSVLIPSDIYDKWTYEIVMNNDKSFKSIADNYYFFGIDELNIKYTDDNIYELSYLINDKKIDVNSIIKGIDISNTYNNEEGNISAEEYKLEKFNLLKCSNDKIVIANKKIKLDINTCLMEK